MKRLLVLAVILMTALTVAWPPPGLAVEGDIVFQRKAAEGDTPPAVFPHWFHRIRYKCFACHPAIVEMKAGANRITMDDIAAGKFCGVCHNGKIAWAPSFETCNRCHVGR